MNTLYMLDTNAVSDLIRKNSNRLDVRTAAAGTERLVVSVISYGETLYGLANNPEAKRLRAAAEHILATLTILDWTARTGGRYGQLRADMRRSGKALQPLDMLIAAHALEAGATLVSSDRAFRFVPGLAVEDWTA
jgi:tRNA(fMet)-specific endonuclease VapC